MIDSKQMRSIALTATLLMVALAGFAQTDPTVMTINGKPISRSCFEYSYNKNNAQNVVDRKSVDEYVDLFINYKLKVEAALAAHMDTSKAFRDEFMTYRNQQIRPSFINDADVEAEAHKIYRESQERVDKGGGLIKAAHILIRMNQKATPDEMEKAKQRIDSIYQALQKGADFADLAKRLSDDKGSAKNGGELPWAEHGMFIKEFENQAFSLKKGEMSKPFTSPVGWHIVKLIDKRNFFPYDSVRTQIMRFIDQRNIKEELIDQRLDSLAKASKPSVTKDKILDDKLVELESKDPNLKYLIQEYHDGLLVYDLSNKKVWLRATEDVAGLNRYFNAHKKKYRWDSPRFKGISYKTREEADVKRVKDLVKSLPYDKWADELRKTFNSDSILRVKVVKGIFKEGDDALVDKEIFDKDTTITVDKDYPYTAVYGKKLKSPKEWQDVKNQVIADYQEELEREWVAQLRKEYPVEVDKEVLKTVNNH